jgi:hypothetical protein
MTLTVESWLIEMETALQTMTLAESLKTLPNALNSTLDFVDGKMTRLPEGMTYFDVVSEPEKLALMLNMRGVLREAER